MIFISIIFNVKAVRKVINVKNLTASLWWGGGAMNPEPHNDIRAIIYYRGN